MKMYATYRRVSPTRVEDVAYWPSATSPAEALTLSAEVGLTCGLHADGVQYGVRHITVPGRRRCFFCSERAVRYALVSYRFVCATCFSSGLAAAPPLTPVERRRMWCESVDRTVAQMLAGPSQSTLGSVWLESPGRVNLRGSRRRSAD